MILMHKKVNFNNTAGAVKIIFTTGGWKIAVYRTIWYLLKVILDSSLHWKVDGCDDFSDVHITVLYSMIIFSYQHDTNFIISNIKSFAFQNNFHILSQDSWRKKSPQESFRIFISTDSIPFLCKKLKNIQYCQSPLILRTLSSPEILVNNVFRSMWNIFNHLLACLCCADLLFLIANLLIHPVHFGIENSFTRFILVSWLEFSFC